MGVHLEVPKQYTQLFQGSPAPRVLSQHVAGGSQHLHHLTGRTPRAGKGQAHLMLLMMG